MADSINTIRHLPLFDANAWNGKHIPIHIIGCGAIGSKVALEVAKLGAKEIHLWDDDMVESHNIANQAFFLPFIGASKVEATENLFTLVGAKCVKHEERYTGQTPLSGVVFLCPDSIDARREIFVKHCKLKPNVKYVVDARMGLMDGRLYFIDPSAPKQYKLYEACSAYTDEQAQVSPCGMPVSVGATSSLMAALAVNGFMRWAWMNELSIVPGTKHKNLISRMSIPPAEIILAMSPEFVVLEQTP